jgi:hypothetical protein
VLPETAWSVAYWTVRQGAADVEQSPVSAPLGETYRPFGSSGTVVVVVLVVDVVVLVVVDVVVEVVVVVPPPPVVGGVHATATVATDATNSSAMRWRTFMGTNPFQV